MLCYFMEKYMFSLYCLLEIMMRWNMHHDSGILGVFICLTFREYLLSSYEVRFLVFSQKHVLAKLGGFFRNVIQGISWSQGQTPARFQALLQSMGMMQWFQEKVARTFKFGQNNIFSQTSFLEKPKLTDQKFSQKNKSINLNSMANLTSNH